MLARLVVALLAVGFVAPPLQAEDAPTATKERLWLRYAVSLETPPSGELPRAAAAYSREELLDRLMDWRPDSDDPEIREVLRLRGLTEVARQATELPPGGGRSDGVFYVGDQRFDVSIRVESISADGVVRLEALVWRAGEMISAPRITTLVGDRASVAATLPDRSTLLLVIEVHRGGLGSEVTRTPPLADGKGIAPPRLVHRVDARYPREAQIAKVEGKVSLRFVVGEDGRVRDVEVIAGLPHGLTEAAIEAVGEWRFEPTRVEGRPTAVTVVYLFDFVLDEDRPPPGRRR